MVINTLIKFCWNQFKSGGGIAFRISSLTSEICKVHRITQHWPQAIWREKCPLYILYNLDFKLFVVSLFEQPCLSCFKSKYFRLTPRLKFQIAIKYIILQGREKCKGYLIAIMFIIIFCWNWKLSVGDYRYETIVRNCEKKKKIVWNYVG